MYLGLFEVWIVCGFIVDFVVLEIGYNWFKDRGYIGGSFVFLNVINRIVL